jgi:hypothetical protein
MACSGDNARSVASTNGLEFWLGGASTTGTGGVWYNTLGATGGEIRVVSTPGDVRVVNIFANQLYGSSNAAGFANVFEIGFGTPTTADETADPLNGMPTTTPNGSPYAYALFDMPEGPSAIDRAYVVDRGNGGAGMPGVHKWTFDGTTWTRAAVLNLATGTPGYRSIAGYAVGQTVTLMADTFGTPADTAPNSLVVFVDTGTGTPVGSVVANAAANTQYRGIAVSPHFAAP